MPFTILAKLFNKQTYVTKTDATSVHNPSKIHEPIFNEQNALEDLKKVGERIEENAYKNNIAKVQSIIENDKAVPSSVDKEQIATYIVDAAKEFSIDPCVIASIAQQETHFNQNVPTGNGSGVMQLTTITIKDLYQRPNYYDPAVLSILKEYKTPNDLIKAIRKDAQLNIRVGAAVYKSKLKAAKGCEQSALRKYNASSRAELYSKEVMSRIAQARAVKSDFALTA